MSWFGFGRAKVSAPVARERLQILLEYERRVISQTDLVAVLRQEILTVISRHVSVDPDKVQVKVDRGSKVSVLAVDVEFPNALGARVGAQC
jgi:cell division topological specificity factor